TRRTRAVHHLQTRHFSLQHRTYVVCCDVLQLFSRNHGYSTGQFTLLLTAVTNHYHIVKFRDVVRQEDDQIPLPPVHADLFFKKTDRRNYKSSFWCGKSDHEGSIDL